MALRRGKRVFYSEESLLPGGPWAATVLDFEGDDARLVVDAVRELPCDGGTFIAPQTNYVPVDETCPSDSIPNYEAALIPHGAANADAQGRYYLLRSEL